MSRRVQHPTNLFYARADPMPPLYPFPARGDVYYNLDLQVLRMWTGTQWETITGSGGGGAPITIGDGVMYGDALSDTYEFTMQPELNRVTSKGMVLLDDLASPSGQRVSFSGSLTASNAAIEPAVLLLFPAGWESVLGVTTVRASLELGNVNASCTATITSNKEDAGWDALYSNMWSDNVIQNAVIVIPGSSEPGGDSPGGYLDSPIVSDGKLVVMSDGRLGLLYVFNDLSSAILEGATPFTVTISYGGAMSSLLDDVDSYSLLFSNTSPLGATVTDVSSVRSAKGELVTRNQIADGAVTDNKLNATSGGYGPHSVTWSGGAGYGEAFSIPTDNSTGGGGALSLNGSPYVYPQSPGFWLVTVGSWFSGFTFPHTARVFMGIAAEIDGVLDYRRFSLGPTESAVGGSALFHFPNVNSSNWWCIKGYQEAQAGSVTMSGEWTAKWLGHAI